MLVGKRIFVLGLIIGLLNSVFGADVILNEYNAVGSDKFLNGGTSLVDEEGGQASDSYFGRVQGNGGDWFELVVITDNLDMRNWKFEISVNGILDTILVLTSHSIWSDLRSGTIITVAENVADDVSYNPAAGDWWINVQANNIASGTYITASNFPVNNDDWQLTIKDSDGNVMFGPAGEGISPVGVANTEIFRLEADPTQFITPDSPDYDDGDSLSTFGSANHWGSQNLNSLRNLSPGPSSIALLSPNGTEIIAGGTIYEITWSNTGTIDSALIEFSLDNGYSWSAVYPPNVGNTGSYNWLVPVVNSEQCRVRVTNMANLSVYDSSSGAFTIYECTLDGDVNGDCSIDMDDFAILASEWLQEANPYE